MAASSATGPCTSIGEAHESSSGERKSLIGMAFRAKLRRGTLRRSDSCRQSHRKKGKPFMLSRVKYGGLSRSCLSRGSLRVE